MKPKHVTTKRGGFVLVVVLGLVLALMPLVLGFNLKTRHHLRTTDALQRSRQALRFARSGLQMAIATLRHQDPCSLGAPRHLELGSATCSVTFISVQGKLNVNRLNDSQGRPDRRRIDQLLRLIDLINKEFDPDQRIGYGLVPVLLDWTDKDEKTTLLPFVQQENKGAESAYYQGLDPPYACDNRPLISLRQFTALKGMTPATLARLRDYLTVHGDGLVALNHAPKLVLQSLSPQCGPALAQMIIDRRRHHPWKHWEELQQLPGMTASLFHTLKRVATLNADHPFVEVRVQSQVSGIGRSLWALLKRNSSTKMVDVLEVEEL